jgi:hypothetical protein
MPKILRQLLTAIALAALLLALLWFIAGIGR